MADGVKVIDGKARAAVRSWSRSERWRAGGVGYERPYFAYLLNTPALFVIVLLAGYPIAYSAWISLHKYSLKRPRIFDFIGLSNFRQILESDEFWAALWITLQFTVLVVVL